MERIHSKKISGLIKEIKNVANRLMQEDQGIQAIERNTDRVLANAITLEINGGPYPRLNSGPF